MSSSDRDLPPRNVEAYFVYPRGGNTGDDLIRRGCLEFLSAAGLDVWESDGSIEAAALAGDQRFLEAALGSFRGFVFFNGGGNIGIYPDNGHIRRQVSFAARCARGILVGPQSARAAEDSLVSDRKCVWARDQVSFEILRAAGVRTRLVPDAAFYLDSEIAKRPFGTGVFQILRDPGRDEERLEHQLTLSQADAGDLTYDLPIEKVVETLLPYRVVVADRLHGAIVGLMLRKRTVILPIGYHKCRSFYETWLSADAGIAYVETLDRLECFIAGHETPRIDLKGLFTAHARPALQSFLDESSRRASRVALHGAILDPQRPRQPCLVSITCVRNEADIVEAFVRHTAAHVDQMILLDNGSTDATRRILDDLQSEGLPLLVLSDASVGYWQSKRMTHLMRDVAVGRCGADWVLPLDVDEFIVTARGQSLRDLLSNAVTPVHVRWVTYVPHASDDPDDANPSTRMRHRASVEEIWHKAFVPRTVAEEATAALQQGNHDVELQGRTCAAIDLDTVYLAHMPIRTAAQFASKISITQLQFLAMHERASGWGFHCRRFYELLKSDEARFYTSWREAALAYAPRGERRSRPVAVEDPIPYAGTPLRYTSPSSLDEKTLVLLLDYAEQLAAAHAAALSALAGVRSHNAGLVDDTQRLQEAQSSLLRTLDEVIGERDRLEAERNALRDERDALPRSRSWRLTAPLRALRALFR